MGKYVIKLMALALPALCSEAYRTSVSAQGNQQTPPRAMSLLPGYTLQRLPSADLLRQRGKIANPDGLVISYDIGYNAGNKARAYAQGTRDAWTFSLTGPHGDDVIVTMDEPGHVAIVTIAEFANFTSENVRTKRDLAELLAMILTYDKDKHFGMKK
jgi:hypothetical protein